MRRNRSACAAEGIELLCWRDVPTDDDAIGEMALAAKPALVQALLRRPQGLDDTTAERLAYRAERRARRACAEQDVRYYAASWSFLTVTYKAMADADQLDGFYPDLRDERFSSALAPLARRLKAFQ